MDKLINVGITIMLVLWLASSETGQGLLVGLTGIFITWVILR